jgi:phosphonoacetaldehyde hydrolase
MHASSPTPRVKLVVLDWAGTAVDHGCFGPVAPFLAAFKGRGVEVTPQQARAPMGLEKKEHLWAIARMPEVAQQWRAVHGRECTEADVEEMYTRRFIPAQLDALPAHSKLIPGLLASVDWLRARGVKVGTTTGYFEEAARRLYEAARHQGFEPDCNVCPAAVSEGRPAPWMIFRVMETLHVFPPCTVVKVGDTVPDVEEGRNAGAWSVGVVRTGSAVGCTEEELAALPIPERAGRCARASRQLRQAGAHEVIDTVAELPRLIEKIERRLADHERP